MRTLTLISLLVCFFTPASALAGPNQNARIVVDLDPSTPAIDSILTMPSTGTVLVAVRSTGVVNLDSYEFHLTFDPRILSFGFGVEDAPFSGITNVLKTRGGSTIGFQCGLVAGSASTLDIANTLIGTDTAQAPESDGILAIVSFNVLGAYRCTLSVSNAVVATSDRVFDNLAMVSVGYFSGAQLSVRQPVGVAQMQRPGGIEPRGMFNCQGRLLNRITSGAVLQSSDRGSLHRMSIFILP